MKTVENKIVKHYTEYFDFYSWTEIKETLKIAKIWETPFVTDYFI